MTAANSFDLIVVGYGPTGLTLASLLGQKGHRVAVVERWPDLYGLPRLTHIDGETARLISLAGNGDEALRESWTTPHFNWFNAKGKLLLDVADDNSKKMIWDDHMSVHQPHIEESIHQRILQWPNVVLFRGFNAVELTQSDGTVNLTIEPFERAHIADADKVKEPVKLTSRYLVGADGSKSFVRTALGIERADFGFNERWLCVDTTPKRPLPERFNEDAIQICDPKRGYMFMPIGRKRQRFEFALLPHESTEAMSKPEAAWQLLAKYHGLGPDDLIFMRNLVYTFECRLAERWRVGNIFLAGDACHTNPPYLGQGACSGMRDAANLAWKFDLVLRNLATDSLLDTYQIERQPHVKALMLQARSLGFIANTSNPVKAFIRDQIFRLKLAKKPPFPTLTEGVLQHDLSGKLKEGSGSLAPQGHLITDGGSKQRFDDVMGHSFVLMLREKAAKAINESTIKRLQSLAVKLVTIDGAIYAHPFLDVIDIDGVYTSLLDRNAADAVLLRPDFVIYGFSSAEQTEDMLNGFLTQLDGSQAPQKIHY